MSEKVLEVEHKPGEEWVVRFNPCGLQWLPEETKRHIYGARKEMLLALRSVVDHAIQRIDESEKSEGRSRTKGRRGSRTKIEVE